MCWTLNGCPVSLLYCKPQALLERPQYNHLRFAGWRKSTGFRVKMTGPFHYQLKSVNISTILTSKLKLVYTFEEVFLGFHLEYMSHFSYVCKTERQNGISHLISKPLRTLNSSLRNRLFHVTEWTFPNSLIIQTC